MVKLIRIWYIQEELSCIFSLHWNGGVGVLSKATAIKEFSVFESASSHHKKVVA